MLKQTLLLLMLAPSAIHAIDVGDISNFMFADETVLVKEISNTVDTARLTTLKVQRISSPLTDGIPIDSETEDEILVTPSGLILPSKATDIFKIYYNGPSDDKERYYHLVWRDLPIHKQKNNTGSNKIALATASAEISTILVVAPRQENFKYKFQDNIVYNEGNVTFRVVGYGSCPKNMVNPPETGCQEKYNIMPGRSIKLQFVDLNDQKSYLGIWHNNQFIPVSQ